MMNYNPFGSFGMGGFRQRDIQQAFGGGFQSSIPQIPMTMGGVRTTMADPASMQARSQQTREGLLGMQQFQTGALNQQILGTRAEQERRGLEDEKMMDLARREVFRQSSMTPQDMYESQTTGRGGPSQFISPFAMDRARREKELEDIEMEKARFMGSFYGGGGFQSWTTPSFPSGGSSLFR